MGSLSAFMVGNYPHQSCAASTSVSYLCMDRFTFKNLTPCM